MLKNRGTAWLISIVIMIVSVPLGATLSFRSMRADVVEVFRAEAEPLLWEQLQMVHNIMMIYEMNANTPETWPRERVERLQTGIERADPHILNTGSDDGAVVAASRIREHANNLGIGTNESLRINSFMTDIEELQLILRQSDYNRLAREFNEATWRGLGHIAIVRRLPEF